MLCFLGEIMKENAYQARLIKEIERRLPGSVILKNDPNYRQGILDLTVLYGPHWGMLEVKPSLNAREQPNQGYYVGLLNEMGFAAIISPENEEDVLNELELALRAGETCRHTFVPQS
jgi:hypothetical protein